MTNRRIFLQQLVRGATCVAALGLGAPGRVFGANERIRIGLIGAGSRGIANIARIVKATVEFVRGCGAKPFIVPAMGSHGGATAEGQGQILAELGITEDNVGAPIVSSTMAVVELERSRFDSPVYVAEDFQPADAIVIINRIKPHTDFSGPIESGIAKMLVIGVAKHEGAIEAHRLFVKHGIKGSIVNMRNGSLVQVRSKTNLPFTKVWLGIKFPSRTTRSAAYPGAT